MVIFHSYVSLPEGTKNFGGFHQQLDDLQECWVVDPLVN